MSREDDGRRNYPPALPGERSANAANALYAHSWQQNQQQQHPGDHHSSEVPVASTSQAPLQSYGLPVASAYSYPPSQWAPSTSRSVQHHHLTANYPYPAYLPQTPTSVHPGHPPPSTFYSSANPDDNDIPYDSHYAPAFPPYDPSYQNISATEHLGVGERVLVDGQRDPVRPRGESRGPRSDWQTPSFVDPNFGYDAGATSSASIAHLPPSMLSTGGSSVAPSFGDPWQRHLELSRGGPPTSTSTSFAMQPLPPQSRPQKIPSPYLEPNQNYLPQRGQSFDLPSLVQPRSPTRPSTGFSDMSRPSTSYSDASARRPSTSYSDLSVIPGRFSRDFAPAHSLTLDNLQFSASSQAVTSPLGPANPLVVSASLERDRKSKSQAGAVPDEPSSSRQPTPSRTKYDFVATCSTCEKEIAKLLFRGESSVGFQARYHCLVCLPLPEVDQQPLQMDATYADSFSAAVDRLRGIPIAGVDTRPPPRRDRPAIQTVRKRRAAEEIVGCDVCTRVVGSGGVFASNPREEIDFGVEVVCTMCSHRYLRCTDCGGGGGARIGVGKWRSRELFADGRRTCMMSHLRLAGLPEMSYDIWPVEELRHASELTELLEICREVFIHQLYATLATPDILESGAAIAQTYEEVSRFAEDGWSVVEPLIREDAESTKSIRRYLALRWATPTHRKTKQSDSPADLSQGETDDDANPSAVVRRGKNLAGFVVVELDLLTGSLHLALTTPWATGDTFDATTILMQRLLRRVKHDIAQINVLRMQVGEPLYPLLEKAWLMTWFRKDSRLTTHLINRRGFLRLEDYLAKYPDTDPTHLPPYRSIFLSAEYLKGWHVLARKISENDDWNARLPPKKRKKKATTTTPTSTTTSIPTSSTGTAFASTTTTSASSSSSITPSASRSR